MIIPDNDSKAALAALDLSMNHLDPPPVYLSARRLLHSRSHSALSDSAEKPLPRVPPPPQRVSSNHIEVMRSDKLKGAWDVDTSLAKRSGSLNNGSPMSPVPFTKSNLRLVSQQGGIDASILLKGNSRGTIEAVSHNGPVTLQVKSDSETRFCLQVSAQNGDVQIHLPHSFYGPIRCRTRSELYTIRSEQRRPPTFSAAMHPHLVALSSEDDSAGEFETVSFFLGDLSTQSSQSSSQWSADEVIIDIEAKAQAYFFWYEETRETVYPPTGLLDGMMTKLKPWQDAVKPWVGKGRRRVCEG